MTMGIASVRTLTTYRQTNLPEANLLEADLRTSHVVRHSGEGFRFPIAPPSSPTGSCQPLPVATGIGREKSALRDSRGVYDWLRNLQSTKK